MSQKSEGTNEMSELSCYFCPVTEGVAPCEHCEGVVAVCSDLRHQKIHRPDGLGACLPIKVDQNDNVGRFLVATRDIKEAMKNAVYARLSR